MIYRIYYNTKEQWPRVWSIDSGSIETELTFNHVHCMVPVSGKYCAEPEEGGPRAWMEADGKLIVQGCLKALIVPVNSNQVD